jgi:predicted O-linked N-acetylglucosamine transferase (SPINDLY family)
LYQLSDVSLDSYPAGGCTTTREALALGSPVVTLPHKYLGSRWSKAYYDIMGMKELVAAVRTRPLCRAVATAAWLRWWLRCGCGVAAALLR